MAHYGISQFFLQKSNLEPRFYSLSTEEQNKARIFMREARSIYRQQNLSFSLQSEIMENGQRIIKMPSVWSNRI